MALHHHIVALAALLTSCSRDHRVAGPTSPDGHTVSVSARNTGGLIADWYATVRILYLNRQIALEWNSTMGEGSKEGYYKLIGSMKWTDGKTLEFDSDDGHQVLKVPEPPR